MLKLPAYLGGSARHHNAAKYSVKDVMRQTSFLEDFVVVDGDVNIKHSIEIMTEYINDFKEKMQQSLKCLSM